MTTEEKSVASRRTFIRLSAGAVALIPVVNLLGCSDGSSGSAAGPAPAADQKPAAAATPAERGSAASAEDAAAEAAVQQGETAGAAPSEGAAGAEAGGAQLMKLEESDPTAKALGYRHAATDVDAGQHPRYQAGQICANCNLYQAGASDEAEWGGCSIFPGKLVNANGWCNAYVGNA